MSDISSQPEDPTLTSWKTLFKDKGKGEGKSSSKASLKGQKHLQISQKVRNILQCILCQNYLYMSQENAISIPIRK